jgi:hypothetical protein
VPFYREILLSKRFKFICLNGCYCLSPVSVRKGRFIWRALHVIHMRRPLSHDCGESVMSAKIVITHITPGANLSCQMIPKTWLFISADYQIIRLFLNRDKMTSLQFKHSLSTFFRLCAKISLDCKPPSLGCLDFCGSVV